MGIIGFLLVMFGLLVAAAAVMNFIAAYDSNDHKQMRTAKLAALPCSLLIVGGVGLNYLPGPPPASAAVAEKSPAAPEKAPDYRRAWAERGRIAVSERLRDPSSAEFDNTFISESGGNPVMCGRVNSKNGFGGYGGYKGFITNGLQVTFFENEIQDFPTAWRTHCSKRS